MLSIESNQVLFSTRFSYVYFLQNILQTRSSAIAETARLKNFPNRPIAKSDEMRWLSDVIQGEQIVILGQTAFAQCTSVTDRQTDRITPTKGLFTLRTAPDDTGRCRPAPSGKLHANYMQMSSQYGSRRSWRGSGISYTFLYVFESDLSEEENDEERRQRKRRWPRLFWIHDVNHRREVSDKVYGFVMRVWKSRHVQCSYRLHWTWTKI